MKRLWIAIGILVASCTICAVTGAYQHHQTATLLQQMDIIRQQCQTGNGSTLPALGEEFQQEFEYRTRLFPLFADQEDVEECQVAVRHFTAMLIHSEDGDPLVEWENCRLHLKMLQDLEMPLLRNIL